MSLYSGLLLAFLSLCLAPGGLGFTGSSVTSIGEIETHIHSWSIPQIRPLKPGDWLESRTIKLGGSGSWRLRAYPQGISANDNNSFTVGSYVRVPAGTLVTHSCCNEDNDCFVHQTQIFFSTEVERWILGADLPESYKNENSTVKCVLSVQSTICD